ncbi:MULTISPECIES: addiction module protein [unclassified Thioalkalivibrio]|uniref:addiction module protein n=1 Tax=unclassified Thioalkalivibrio TaxID=2621013 RepID=UPI00036C862F|nr:MULTISPECIES: addiction module protein [unclassified Thioalkalivibrio]
MKIKDLIDKANSLPVEERGLVAESLLRSLNPPDAGVDRKWAEVSRKRLEDVRSGSVDTVPGDEVFRRIFRHKD